MEAFEKLKEEILASLKKKTGQTFDEIHASSLGRTKIAVEHALQELLREDKVEIVPKFSPLRYRLK